MTSGPAFVHWLILAIFALLSSLSNQQCIGNISTTEHSALETFFNILHGEAWLWDPGEPIWYFPSGNAAPCSEAWQGLNCSFSLDDDLSSDVECSISALRLAHHNLVGSLPLAVLDLTALEYLSLPTNRITNTIPVELASFNIMKMINFDDNKMNGTLPSELSQISTLSVLSFAANHLHGTIPSIMGSMPALEILELSANSFTGTIPPELCSIESMKLLLLHNNLLHGTIPTEIGDLSQLKVLFLANNSLTGTLPTEIGNLMNVHRIDVDTNQLYGPIPTQLTGLNDLQQLYLQVNSFSGTLSTEFGKMTWITILDVSVNSLTSTIPSQLMNLSSINALSIELNLFTGILPSWVGVMSSIQVLYVTGNLLTSSLPAALGQLTRLYELDLDANYFSSSLPAELGEITNISQVVFAANLLTGTIPSTYGRWHYLKFFLLSHNQFSGTLPALAPTLVELEASDNNFLHGPVLEQLTNCRRLRLISLGGNQFNGTLPSALSELLDLQSLNLSSCAFSGNLDVLALSTWGDDSDDINVGNKSIPDKPFGRLELLVLSDNFFTGTLPPSLFTQPLLRTVLMNQNCFEGSIPPSICENPELQNLVLDSLTQNCGNAIPSVIRSIFQGYLPSHFMVGELPSCLWNMTSLKVLHVQGNGLAGSLRDLPGLSTKKQSQLSVVSVGSNRLTGTIPWSFQSRVWEQLDLSANRFGGTLSSSLMLDAFNTTVYDLTVNRLSGGIPDAMLSLEEYGVLNVLNGNLFGCESGLPATDPDIHSYVCGSQSFEDALLAWLVAVVVAIACIGITVTSASASGSSAWHCSWWDKVDIKRWTAAADWDRHFLLITFTHTLLVGGAVFVALLGFIVFKMPSLWRQYFVTHLVQYWWTTTIAFMQSWPVVLFILLLIVFLCTALSWIMLSLVDGVLFLQSDSLEEGNERNGKITRSSFIMLMKTLCRGFALHSLNVLVVLTINAVYVVDAVPRYSGVRLLFIQSALSIFKLLWSLLVPWMVEMLPQQHRLANNIFMNLFIFIGAPFFSTFLADESCFTDLISPPSTLQSVFSVPVLQCETTCTTGLFCEYENLLDPELDSNCHLNCVEGCKFAAEGQVQIDVIAPWLYSYQCSSSVIRDYVPVLIIAYLLTGVFMPLVYAGLIAQHSYEYRQLPPKVRQLVKYWTEQWLPLLCSDPDQVAHRANSLPVSVCQKIVVKLFVNITVLLTFGLASPLLAIVVGLEGMAVAVIGHVLMDKFVQACLACSKLQPISAAQLQQSFMQICTVQFHHCLCILMAFVGIFWSLFVLDMIGDNDRAALGGGCAVMTLCLPVLAYLCTSVCFVHASRSQSPSVLKMSDSSNRTGVEMTTSNPISYPQTTTDEFS